MCIVSLQSKIKRDHLGSINDYYQVIELTRASAIDLLHFYDQLKTHIVQSVVEVR